MEDYTVSPITRGPKFHFKPYYGMQPWDDTGRYFLCMESDFQSRPPTKHDTLTVGVCDLNTSEFLEVGQTNTWNFQQGCMPHWLINERKEIIFNSRDGDTLQSTVVDFDSRKKRYLPKPIQAITPDMRIGASLNFARWENWRNGYGYKGLTDPYENSNVPYDDSIFQIDVHTGEFERLISLRNIIDSLTPGDKRIGSPVWFCHLLYNTNGSRLAGLVRYWCPNLRDDVLDVKLNIDGAVPERRHTLWVVDSNGKNLKILVHDALVSHATWFDEDNILFWGSMELRQSPAYILLNVKDGSYRIIGKNYLHEDGHMTFHKDRRWLLTDTYPNDELFRTLKVYDTENDKEIILGEFFAPQNLQGELRCDLHPCWNRDFTKVAIDSIHERGERQVYSIDVGTLPNEKMFRKHITL